MKGIVFTEFIEMVEEKYGFEIVDKIISENTLASGGVYTSIGTYNHKEMFALVKGLEKEVGVSSDDLFRFYGTHMIKTFINQFPNFFIKASDAFAFLESVDNYIHVEVLKLYPDAQLPSFECDRKSENELIMRYKSERGMSDFAHGLILGSLAYYKEEAQINIDKKTSNYVVFTIKKNA